MAASNNACPLPKPNVTGCSSHCPAGDGKGMRDVHESSGYSHPSDCVRQRRCVDGVLALRGYCAGSYGGGSVGVRHEEQTATAPTCRIGGGMKRPFITTDRYLAFMLVCFVGIVVATYLTRPDEHPMTAKRFEYGTVTKIHSCATGKRSYRCELETTLGRYASMNVGDFPGQHVEVGDTLFYEKRSYGPKVETWMCSNASCLKTSTCYWWMPCMSAEAPQN